MTEYADDLVAAAVAVRLCAYAPYSGFFVGAAIRSEVGIHAGCNVENAAYPQGNCAEAGAISAMVAAGGRQIREVVIAGDGATPVTPCGGCRQRLREFGAPELVIRMVGVDGGARLVRTLGELLPDSFGPDHLAPDSSVRG
ncbi:cytidine deaminase [Acidomonas methanolica]|uniref:Cytidine deaminase n=1 Tax=Acidomonas methanolica NBRC 104435 TaxID=1231351 RepID=A0A023D3W0_ACIMT|nr:cytidine deaminase [Acidomonas methanolica]MBU2653651.1 cytidine deaminase [Acidomonas methanolica]TCS31603.1 cytidine deaminase [Acidomonas methanolica]GAJ28817.1 cytidine deaminase [Acidomonas methanolica NBRC 104435]GBQ52002.1 cytidine deaminase [Acidomonas methanolica]GEK98021.1 cytidine deaminase [Acidomonas methanolica NBRC 104435]